MREGLLRHSSHHCSKIKIACPFYWIPVFIARDSIFSIGPAGRMMFSIFVVAQAVSASAIKIIKNPISVIFFTFLFSFLPLKCACLLFSF
jgi:hypothetical protein